MSSTKGMSDPQRKENDFYETPQWCIDLLVKELRDLYGGVYGRGVGLHIIDLGAGDGRIGRSVHKLFPGAVLTFNDINEPSERLDGERWVIGDVFAEWQNIIELPGVCHEYVQILFVGNLPFSLADDISVFVLDQLMRNLVASVGVFLHRLNWLGSEQRAEWHNQNPISRITVLSPRPSFCLRETRTEEGKIKKSSNDSCEYAWLWWENQRRPGEFIKCVTWELKTRSERLQWYKKYRR